MRTISTLLAVIALAACGSSEQPVEPAPSAASRQAAAAEAGIYGSWRVVEINGRAPITLPGPDAPEPTLAIGTSSYSGSTGCNGFGGTSLLHEGRLYALPPVATQQGCAHLTEQESAIFRLAASAPTVERVARGELRMRGGGVDLRLRRHRGAAPAQPLSEPPLMLLAGTRWRITVADARQHAGSWDDVPLLQFEADAWTLKVPCGVVAGQWRQEGNAAVINVGDAPETCRTEPATVALTALAGASLPYVVGPNREFLMAGRGHFVGGEFDRELGADDEALIAGEWRVAAIDGRPPAASPTPPKLMFGRAAYSAWDGCNRREGILVARARQLFTYGSGLTTLAQCPREQVSARVHDVLAGHPRIARTASGLALVTRSGRLDLERVSRRGFGRAEKVGLRAGIAIDLLLPDGKARLTLGANRRFTVDLGCGRLEGDWRAGQPARFSMEPPDRHAPACPLGPGTPEDRVMRLFQGDVEAVTDANGERVLLVGQEAVMADTVARD